MSTASICRALQHFQLAGTDSMTWHRVIAKKQMEGTPTIRQYTYT